MKPIPTETYLRLNDDHAHKHPTGAASRLLNRRTVAQRMNREVIAPNETDVIARLDAWLKMYSAMGRTEQEQVALQGARASN
jgi:hypothetical protein